MLGISLGYSRGYIRYEIWIEVSEKYEQGLLDEIL